MTPPLGQTRNAAVLEEIRQRIVRGVLRPGDRILADTIAEELGISRIPVREALRVLEGERQVSYEPHRGYFVTDLTFGDLKELYLIRNLLEVEALRRSVPELDRADFGYMELALKELQQANKSDDIVAHAAANRRFHFAFFGRLEMPRLLSEIKALYDQCDVYASLYTKFARNRQRSRRDHLGLYRAAKQRDPEQVIGLLLEHREYVVDALRGVDETGTEGLGSDVQLRRPVHAQTTRRPPRGARTGTGQTGSR